MKYRQLELLHTGKSTRLGFILRTYRHIETGGIVQSIQGWRSFAWYYKQHNSRMQYVGSLREALDELRRQHIPR